MQLPEAFVCMAPSVRHELYAVLGRLFSVGIDAEHNGLDYLHINFHGNEFVDVEYQVIIAATPDEMTRQLCADDSRSVAEKTPNILSLTQLDAQGEVVLRQWGVKKELRFFVAVDRTNRDIVVMGKSD